MSLMSLSFEIENLNTFEIIPIIECTKEKLHDIMLQDDYVPKAAVMFKLQNRTLQESLHKNDHLRRKEENRDYMTITCKKMMNVLNAESAVEKIKSKVIKDVANALDS